MPKLTGLSEITGILHTPGARNVQSTNVQHCPQCATFFEQFVFCPVSPLWNSQEKFLFKNDKTERKWGKHGFQSDKIDL